MDEGKDSWTGKILNRLTFMYPVAIRERETSERQTFAEFPG